jgi:membrane protein implicated in regulation of membrane protease activity
MERMRRPVPSRAALLRYWAFQLPGWGLAAALSFVAWEWFGVPAWAAWLALALWIAKDAVMAPLLAHAYEGHGRGGPHDLVDRRGVAEGELAPRGTVRIGPERWRAVCVPGVERIAAGSAVRVVAIEGLTAVVEPA